ncbi:MAG: thioredoxin family protein [Cytophagaceae bacterium]
MKAFNKIGLSGITVFLIALLFNTACIAQTGFTDVNEIEKEIWFEQNYDAYTPEAEQIEQLNVPDGVEILVFGGTWCPDTRRLVPEFYNIMDEAGVDREQAPLYLIDRDFTSDLALEEKFDINSVPTFVILKDGKEAGRIVNPSPGSLEQEIVDQLEKIDS